MRILLLPVALLTTFLVPATSTAAGQMTLRDLQKICGAAENAPTADGSAAACRFYILGAFEGLSVGGAANDHQGQFTEKQTGKLFCVPDDLPDSAMRQKVLELAEADVKAYPTDADMPAISFIAAVITKSYPCG